MQMPRRQFPIDQVPLEMKWSEETQGTPCSASSLAWSMAALSLSLSLSIPVSPLPTQLPVHRRQPRKRTGLV